MCGGLFLVYEGAEKIIHRFWPHALPHDEEQNARRKANADETVDLVAFEKKKSKARYGQILFYPLRLSSLH